MTLNNDTDGYYQYQSVSGFNATEYAGDTLSASYWEMPWANAGFGDGNETDLYLIDFFDYTQTDRDRVAFFRTGNSGSYKNVTLAAGILQETGALSSIEFATSGDLLLAGGRFDLYGIAG